MTFDNLSGDGDSIGVGLILPNGSGQDFSGFGWVYRKDTASYDSASYWQDGITKEVTLDASWLCSSYPDTESADKTKGYCYHFQPLKSAKQGGNYRWSANDTLAPVGWTNISGVMSIFDITSGQGATLLSAT